MHDFRDLVFKELFADLFMLAKNICFDILYLGIPLDSMVQRIIFINIVHGFTPFKRKV